MCVKMKATLTKKENFDPFKDSPLEEEGDEGAEKGQWGPTLGHLHCFVFEDEGGSLVSFKGEPSHVQGRVAIGGFQFCAFCVATEFKE